MASMTMTVPTMSPDLESVAASLQQLIPRLLSSTQNVTNDPIIKVAQPSDVARLQSLSAPGEAQSIETVVEEAFDIFDHRMRVNHPRFMGLIPSPTSPVAWVGDVVASAFNALGASKIQASGPVLVEKTLISWLASQVGLPAETSGGVCVSGGSMANLMGIVLARDRHVPQGDLPNAVAYLSDQTHYSVVKALRLLGFAYNQIRRLPADAQFRMRPEQVEEAIQADRKAGLVPFLVVGTCGTTNSGAVDPLAQLSQVCDRNNVWFHVDGAYGASAVLSKSQSAATNGLELADSLSWDAHKWLFQTYSCGLLLVKDKRNLVKSFANQGDYLRDGVAIEDDDIPNFWNYTMELTRPASRAMKLWFTLRVLGTDAIGTMIDHGFLLAHTAEQEFRRLPEWEIISPASMGVVTFRYAPTETSEEERERMNSSISQALVSDNVAGIMTTRINGIVALRICALHPNLSVAEMIQICKTADEYARKLRVDGT